MPESYHSADLPEFHDNRPLLLCFSHLRWEFVFQRPQHLMMRLAKLYRIIFWEEPVNAAGEAWLRLRSPMPGITIATPHLPDRSSTAPEAMLRAQIDTFLREAPGPALLWYYTPMMLPFTRHLPAPCIVYDCMDELANFRFAPRDLLVLEEELLGRANLVFTGGYSLYEAKKARHPDVHPFPSSVDVGHFHPARSTPPRQIDGAPTFGFYGVIDERMDLALVAAVADARPHWNFVLVGPVVKIDPDDLPQRPNISYPGPCDYADLPVWLGRWHVALMPFAINEATRFISPTKTPEYLAAGRPVVSTAIVDVARHYGELAAVSIASSTERFVQACDEALALAQTPDDDWLAAVDAQLASSSWDRTVAEMVALIRAISRPAAARPAWTNYNGYDVLVVGAGFAGAVMAERLAADGGRRVLVIDKRPHIAGNAFDRYDEAGVLIHQYGPHIFHTNAQDVVDYLSRFTRWRSYEHRVLAQIGDDLLPVPINRTTLNRLYGLDLQNEEEARVHLAGRAERLDEIKSARDVVVAAAGRDLYRRFFEGYTRKQWGLDPSELDKTVTARVPTRTNDDDRYFTDRFQMMPLDGYTAMFERILDHPNIDVQLGVEFRDVRSRFGYRDIVFTGPIDEYFDYRYGRLPYRSLQFQHETLDSEWFQPVAVVNYPEEQTPYTRITEYKHLTGQAAARTSITYEFPCDVGEPYYPVPREAARALYKRYELLALAEPHVTFVGRLATYRYYNMDQVVGQALAAYRRMALGLDEVQSTPSAGRVG
ncbi:UDP-galactopyranose mutase [Sphingomonas zeicaulis]|uniref:UDP-galactopyranose mutase n=1 Tax=Sphingomonas zeicaulis TaxID=1632740 RepID=UPI003D256F60